MAMLVLVILLCYLLADKYLSRFLKIDFTSRVEKFVFLEGLGLGVLAYGTFILGMCGLLYRELFYVIMIAAIFLAYDRMMFIFEALQAVQSGIRQLIMDRVSASMALLFTVYIALNLVLTLTPPTGWDELVYHLALPKMFIEHHQIFKLPNIMYSNWIMAQDMLYIFGMLVKSDILAKLFHFAMGILTTMAIYSFTRRYFSHRTALLASLIFYSVPEIAVMSTNAYVELGLAFFEMLAVYAAVNWLALKKDPWLILSAVFCGLAIGTKYLGIFSYFSIVAMILLAGSIYHKLSPTTLIKKTGLFSAVVFLVSFIWYLKNLFYTGNPVFPFLNNIFRSKLWYLTAGYAGHGPEPFGMGNGILDYIKLPWNMTFLPHFFGWEVIGPVFVVSLPLLCLLILFGKIKMNEAARNISIYTGVFFVLWAVSSQYIRYFLPVLCFTSILAAYTITTLASIFNKNFSRALMIFVAILIMLNLPFLYPYIFRQDLPMNIPSLVFPAASGSISRDAYLMESALPYNGKTYPGIKFVNENLPPSAKVMTIWGFSRYYYNGGSMMDYDYYPEFQMSLKDLFWPNITPDSWRDLYPKLKQLGITHLVMNLDSEFIVKNTLNIDGFYAMAEKHLKLLYSYKGIIKVYEVL